MRRDQVYVNVVNSLSSSSADISFPEFCEPSGQMIPLTGFLDHLRFYETQILSCTLQD